MRGIDSRRPPFKKRSIFSKNKTELITLSIRDYNIRELFHDFRGRGIHEIDSATIVWFFEGMFFGESVGYGGSEGGSWYRSDRSMERVLAGGIVCRIHDRLKYRSSGPLRFLSFPSLIS